MYIYKCAIETTKASCGCFGMKFVRRIRFYIIKHLFFHKFGFLESSIYIFIYVFCTGEYLDSELIYVLKVK